VGEEYMYGAGGGRGGERWGAHTLDGKGFKN